MKIWKHVAVATTLAVAVLGALPGGARAQDGGGDRTPHPSPRRGDHPGQITGAAGATGQARIIGNGINYNGGPIMTGTVTAHIVWYGAWTAANQSILTGLLGSIGGSPYYNINTTYYNAAGTKVSNSVALGAQYADPGSVGLTNLSDTAIRTIVTNAVNGGKLPKDPNAVYFVLTGTNVTKSGFLTQYCGWHTSATIGGASLKYSFVGNPTGPNINSCAAQTASSPNGSPGVDAMASVVAHELEETATDPLGNAWYDSRGYENADKCAWTFGTTYKAANGSSANMKLGGHDFLIQRNWLNANGGSCVLGY